MKVWNYFKKRRKKALSRNYIIGDSESISISNINIDLRNPKSGKKYLSIGKNSMVNINACFETEEGIVEIGDNVNAGAVDIICRNKVQIDDNVLMAWGILLYDHNSHSFDYLERRKDIEKVVSDKKNGRDVIKFKTKNWDVVYDAPIHICHDAWIGEGVTILSGVTIGEGAIIGAGSVVRESVPPWTIAYGNPCTVVDYNRYKPEEE